jgi:hypothetical protein
LRRPARRQICIVYLVREIRASPTTFDWNDVVGADGCEASTRLSMSDDDLHAQRHIALVQTEFARAQRDRQGARQGVAVRTHKDPAAPSIDEEGWP